MARHPFRALSAVTALVLAVTGLSLTSSTTTSPAAAAPGDQLDLVLLLDGSGSISRSDWDLQLEGYSAALRDRVNFPVDGSVAVSVIQWSYRGANAENVRVEVPLTVLDSAATVDSVIADMLAIVQIGSSTNPGDAILAGTAELVERGRAGADGVLCMSTDGPRNSGVTLASATATARAAGVDRFSVVAIADGSFNEARARTEYGPHVFGGGTVTFARTTAEFTTLISGCAADPLHLVALEVTQGVQDLDNSVLVVRGRDTLVRAYLATLDGDRVRTTARLRGFANGRELALSPLTPINSGNVLVDGNALADRADPTATLNFELPLSWTHESDLELALEYPGGLVCLDQSTTNPLCTVTVGFVDAMSLDITYHAISWDENGQRVGRTVTDLAEQAARVYAQLPIGYDYRESRTEGHITLDRRPTNLSDVNERLAAARRAAGAPAESRWYGVLPGFSGNGQGGRAAGHVGSGWDADLVGERAMGHARNRVTHELGHMLGLHHSVNAAENGHQGILWWAMKRGWCNEVADGSAPEFPHWRPGVDTTTGISAALGPMARVREEVWGTDLRFFGTSRALALSNPNETTSLMSYCSAEQAQSQHRWISAHDWELLLTEDLTPIGGRDVDPTGDGAGLLIRATITPEGPAVLAPALPVAEAPTGDDPDGTHELVLVDAAGDVVHEVAFTPLESHDDVEDEEGGIRDFLVGVVVPDDLAGATEVEIRFDGETLVTGAVSTSAPTVAVGPPGSGTPQDVTFAWSAEDPDGDELRHTVMYSADDGDTWSVVAIDVTATEVDVPRWALAGSESARVRVLSSDGLRAASATSEPFSMPDLAPSITIDRPEDEVLVSGAQTIVFAASASDAEDGGAVAESIVWESDLDGRLGTGPSVHRRADTLREGTHTVTATVRDSAGQTASATTTIHVQRVTQPPVEEPATCAVRHVVHGQWSTGYTSQLWIRNTGTEPIDGWTLEWALPPGQSIAHHWSSTMTMTGTTVTATNLGWNSRINPGQEITFGFNGAKSIADAAALPAEFRLNGGICEWGAG